MLRIALTGGIATGKTHVATRLQEAGIPVIDADTLARAAVAPGSAGLAAVVQRFGAGVLTADGTLDRQRLGAVVFADEAARRDLEAIVHPYVRQRIDEFFATRPADTHLAVADIPLLFETGRAQAFDRVVVTACARETQLARIVARDGLSREEAERRVASQWPLADKVTRADHVIWTDGSVEDTDRQVRDLVAALEGA